MAPLSLLLALAAHAGCREGLAARVAAEAARRPGLKGLAIETRLFRDDEDFGRAWPGRAWRSAPRRLYVVKLNERLCTDPPPPAALRSLILHELAHLEDYARRGRRSLLALGWAYLRGDESVIAPCEKAADDAAAAAGGAAGLLAYREWMLARVSPAAAARKRRLYRTPEELAALTRPTR